MVKNKEKGKIPCVQSAFFMAFSTNSVSYGD